MEEINGDELPKQGVKHKGKHDKDKPWDDPSIDHWKVEKFDPSWNESGMVDVSSFSTIFPQYRGFSLSLSPFNGGLAILFILNAYFLSFIVYY